MKNRIERLADQERRYLKLRRDVGGIIKKLRLVALGPKPDSGNPGAEALMLLIAVDLDGMLGRRSTKEQIAQIENLVAEVAKAGLDVNEPVKVTAKITLKKKRRSAAKITATKKRKR